VADSDEVVPHFPCIWKSCKSEFTQTSPCYHRSSTGVQARVVLCETCLFAYEMAWAPDRPKVRLPMKLIRPWEPEGKRILKSAGLYDPADPRVWPDGIVPDRYKPKEARRKQQ
jgi:hypothetical protein